MDIEAIFRELQPLEKEGVSTAGRLLVSDRATILFDFHKVSPFYCNSQYWCSCVCAWVPFQLIDGLQEQHLSKDGSSIGTTKKGIGPAYATKASRNGLRIGKSRCFTAC